jgi:hypothetical protein
VHHTKNEGAATLLPLLLTLDAIQAARTSFILYLVISPLDPFEVFALFVPDGPVFLPWELL